MDRRRTWTLSLAATVSVALLLVITDIAPMAVDDFQKLPSNTTRVEAVCLLSTYHNATNGIMVDLTDSNGVVLRAYVDTRKIQFTPVNGSYVKVIGTYQPGTSPILFVDTIARLDQDKFIKGSMPDSIEVATCM